MTPERGIDKQIAEGYRRIPPTADEVGTPDVATWDALDDEDWRDWE